MGCVSSRTVKPSKSYHDDGIGGHHQRSNSTDDLALELLLNPKTSHQFLALLCSSNTTVPENKLRSLPPPEELIDDSPESQPEVINAWELMAGIDNDDEIDADGGRNISSVLKPSESSGTRLVEEEASVNVRTGSCAPEVRQPLPDEEEEGEPVDQTFRNFQVECQSAEDADAEEAPVVCRAQEEDTGSCKNLSSMGQKEAVSVSMRRGKEMTALTLPVTVEFPTVGSLREWLQSGGEVFSPGLTAVMPKFSCMDECRTPPLRRSMSTRKEFGGGGLDPELLEAFEEAVAELKAEEEQLRLQIQTALG